MSRPPRPHPARSTGGRRTDAEDRLDYLPLDFAAFVELQRRVAVRALGRTDDAEPDTLMELSALVGHVLAVYQRQFAREAFISTALAPSSLVRHAHRLGAEPDPGLSASGHVVLYTKPGVHGTVAARHPLASAAVGQETAKDYETGEDVAVDAALNELRPVGATTGQVVVEGGREVVLDGVGLGLEPGEIVVLTGGQWQGVAVETVTERAGTTLVRLAEPVPARATEGLLLARPGTRLGTFAASADPALYPPAAVRHATNQAPTPAPNGPAALWYAVARTDGAAYRDDDVYLGQELDRPIGADWVLRSTGAGLEVYRVADEGLASVTLYRSVQVDVTAPVVTIVPSAGGGFTTTVTQPATRTYTPQVSHVSGTVAVVRLDRQSDVPGNRSDHPVESTWATGWELRAPYAAQVPNPEPLTQPLVLPGLHEVLAPGRPVVFADPRTGDAQVVRLRRVQLDPVAGTTAVEWDALTPDPETPWTLDRLVVHGNVVPVSHGRTVRERLAVSDGVTPFQRRELKESPLSHLPGVAGAEPEFELRVAGVRWARVVDFADSGPDDRHYRLVTAADHGTTVVFGDGRTGAVPPAGAALEATYLVGIGVDANVPAGRVTRVKRAHPLLDHVVNLTPVRGGAEPARPEEVRTQATRRIRTFDRAVSVPDLADLALTMPGVARAAARWDQHRGALLVVATAEGLAPQPRAAVRAFLDARRDTGLPLTLLDPVPHELGLAVRVDPDPDWLPEAVASAVRAALTTRFSFPAQQLGQPGYLSEVYALLEALPGVVSVRVERFASAPYAGVADAVRPDLAGWLTLPPQLLDVVISS